MSVATTCRPCGGTGQVPTDSPFSESADAQSENWTERAARIARTFQFSGTEDDPGSLHPTVPLLPLAFSRDHLAESIALATVTGFARGPVDPEEDAALVAKFSQRLAAILRPDEESS